MAVGALVVSWAVFVEIRFDTAAALARWWVRRADVHGDRAGIFSCLISVAALAGYVAVALVGAALASVAGDRRWALLIAGPAVLAYVPFTFATMPYRGYWAWRAELARAGADPRLQRAIAWWAGPPSLFGIVSMTLTLLMIFVD